jgi:hypothetical protein
MGLTKPKCTLLVRLKKHNSDTTCINGGTDVTRIQIRLYQAQAAATLKGYNAARTFSKKSLHSV